MKNPPEFKKFRAIAWTVYLVLAVWVCGALYAYAYFGARARQGRVPDMPAAGTVDAARLTGCAEQLQALQHELDQHIDQVIRVRPAKLGRAQWDDWSPGWRARLLASGANCRLEVGDVPGTRNLKLAFDRLSGLHRQYSTLATQFSKEIGPHVDALDEAMKQAVESVAPPQQP